MRGFLRGMYGLAAIGVVGTVSGAVWAQGGAEHPHQDVDHDDDGEVRDTLKDGLVAYWPTPTEGHSGPGSIGLEFDGVDDYVDLDEAMDAIHALTSGSISRGSGSTRPRTSSRTGRSGSPRSTRSRSPRSTWARSTRWPATAA